MTNARGAKRPKGRTLAEFGKLSTAERQLLACAAAGEIAVFGNVRPGSANDANKVRGAFIRFLALGGDEDAPVHETGVQLQGAWIEGALVLRGVETTSGLLLLDSDFSEPPFFYDARVTGALALSGSRIPGLQGDRLACDGPLFLRDGFISTDEVRLLGAKIGGDLACRGGTFQSVGGNALNADGIDVGGSVFLDKSFNATGTVRLIGAKIGSNFECSGGTFQNKGGDALDADRIDVRGSLLLNKTFTASGTVRLLGAKIGSNFECSGGTFRNEGGEALNASGVDTGGDLFMKDKFNATGEVRLVGAKIGGNFECNGGTFQNKNAYALSADRIDVRGSVFLMDNFKAAGTVRLPGSKIGSDLALREGLFESDELAVNLQGARIDGALMIDLVTIEAGVIDLNGTRVARLIDNERSWEKGVILDGFVYGAIVGGARTDARMRIGWLDKQPGAHSGKNGKGLEFRPQPWLQLRKVLREMGHYEAAREVGIAFERRKRQCGLVGQVPEISAGPALRAIGGWVYGNTARLLHIGYGALVGYGYRPLRLLMISTVVWLVFGGGYFAAARWDGAFVPSTQALFSRYGERCGLPAHVRWTDCKAIRLEYPQFYPLAYSLNGKRSLNDGLALASERYAAAGRVA